MNWLHFLLWVAGIYFLYYLVVILLDVAGSGNAPADKSSSNELTFSESVQTQRLEHEPENAKPNKPGVNNPGNKPESEVLASGGVPIKDISRLARQDLLIYTRAVSF